MAFESRRSLLMLCGVVVLGVGGRMWRSRTLATPASPDAVAQLESQLALVDAARGTGDGRRGKSEKGNGSRKSQAAPVAGSRRARTRVANSPEPSMATPRTELTPIGALDSVAAAHRLRPPGVVPSPPRADSRRAAAPAVAAVVDVDDADARTLQSLPGIGPSLSRRIVLDRSKKGAFGSLGELQRVRGVGPALARQLEGRVTFGGTRRPSVAEFPAKDAARVQSRPCSRRDRPP